jgi:ATP-dependent DNA ligase
MTLGHRSVMVTPLIGDRCEAVHMPDRFDARAFGLRFGAVVFRHACRMGLEGTVSKRLTAPYWSGRSPDWLKVKNPDSPAMVRAREGEW